MIDRTRSGDVHVLTMRAGENLLNPGSVEDLSQNLDAVEKESRGPGALVLAGEGKFFSNGIDLDYLMNAAPEDQAAFAADMEALFHRVLLLPLPTVAALNGHAFAGGAILALACDFRVQRRDRGWISISEVDVGVPIGDFVMRMIASKLPPATAREAVLTGRRYAAEEALAAGLVDETAPESELLSQAIATAGTLASKERRIFRLLKNGLYGRIAAAESP